MKPAAILTTLFVVGIAAIFWMLLRTPEVATRGPAETVELAAQPSVPAATATPPQGTTQTPPLAPATAPAATQAQAERAESAALPRTASAQAQPPDWTSVPQSIWGFVRGPKGPLLGALVAAVDGEGRELSSAGTVEDGSFQLPIAETGSDVLLRVTHPDHASFQNGPYRLREGQKRNAGILRLQSRALLSGRVLDPDKQPIEGASISVTSGVGSGSPNRYESAARSDDKGAFVVEDAPAGSVRVKVSAQGFAQANLSSLRLPLAEALEIELQPSEALVVDVSDSRGPIAGAEVRIVMDGRGGSTFRSRTESDGRAQVAGVAQGHWAGAVHAPGYHEAAIDGFGTQSSPVAVVLERLACVRGRIFAASEAAPEGTRVAILPVGSEHRRVDDSVLGGTTQPDGTFEVCGVEPGSWLVRAVGPNLAPATSNPIEVTRDSSPEVELHLTSGGALDVRVQASSGLIAKASVGLVGRAIDAAELRVPARDVLREATTDANGMVRFENLAPGAYWLALEHAEHVPQREGPWTVSDRGAPPLAVISLTPGRVITGTVLLPSGAPAVGASVRVRAAGSSGGIVGEATTRSDGTYATTPLAPGTVELSVSAAQGQASLELEIEPEGDAPQADLQLNE